MNTPASNADPTEALYDTLFRWINGQRRTPIRTTDTIERIITDYNANMSAYQQNMRELISVLQLGVLDASTRRRQAARPRREMYDFTYVFTDNPRTRDNRAGLNTDEIGSATTRVVYDPLTTTHHQCPIGLETFNAGDELLQINVCGHTFIPDNLIRWFNASTVCPVCRYNLLDTFDSYTTSGDT